MVVQWMSVNQEEISSVDEVLAVTDIKFASLEGLLARYQMVLNLGAEESIPGSFWGGREAGLKNNTLYVRKDTPVHSVFHEASHYVCMSADRRASLDTNAGGDYDEENGVCYLQILLADYLPEMSRDRMMLDMDRWGYSFRLGSARRWFEEDAEDARQWLYDQHLIDIQQQPLWVLRS